MESILDVIREYKEERGLIVRIFNLTVTSMTFKNFNNVAY